MDTDIAIDSCGALDAERILHIDIAFHLSPEIEIGTEQTAGQSGPLPYYNLAVRQYFSIYDTVHPYIRRRYEVSVDGCAFGNACHVIYTGALF